MWADVRGLSAHAGGHVETNNIQIGIKHVKIFYTHIMASTESPRGCTEYTTYMWSRV